MLTGVQDFRFGSQSIPGSVPTECHPWSILSKSEDWKHKHGAQFEPSKYMLIHFTRNTRHDVSAAIQLNHVTISPTGEACCNLRSKTEIPRPLSACHKERYQVCSGTIQHCKNYVGVPPLNT